MVVDDVKNYGDPIRMELVNELFKFIWSTISVLHRKRKNCVVTPVSGTRELGNWHEFYRIYAQFRKFLSSALYSSKSALAAESANVQFVHYHVFQLYSTPFVVCPRKR